MDFFRAENLEQTGVILSKIAQVPQNVCEFFAMISNIGMKETLSFPAFRAFTFIPLLLHYFYCCRLYCNSDIVAFKTIIVFLLFKKGTDLAFKSLICTAHRGLNGRRRRVRRTERERTVKGDWEGDVLLKFFFEKKGTDLTYT